MKGFRRVLAAETISNFGSMLSRLAIPWLATLALEVEPWQMGLLLVADVAAGAAVLLALAALAAAGALAFWMLVAGTPSLRVLAANGMLVAPGSSLAGALLPVAHQVIGDGGRTVYDVHDRT